MRRCAGGRRATRRRAACHTPSLHPCDVAAVPWAGAQPPGGCARYAHRATVCGPCDNRSEGTSDRSAVGGGDGTPLAAASRRPPSPRLRPAPPPGAGQGRWDRRRIRCCQRAPRLCGGPGASRGAGAHATEARPVPRQMPRTLRCRSAAATPPPQSCICARPAAQGHLDGRMATPAPVLREPAEGDARWTFLRNVRTTLVAHGRAAGRDVGLQASAGRQHPTLSASTS